MEIETAIKALPQDQKRLLLTWLANELRDPTTKNTASHSILDIPPVSLGGILRPLTPDDDLLGEMLE